jgi:heptosyltransferase III
MKVQFERWSRNAMSHVIGVLFPAPAAKPETVRAVLQQSPHPKILLIRPHQGLGDLLLASPMFRALKTAFPNAELHFLADNYNYIAVERNPHLARLWLWKKKEMQRLGALLSFIRALRRERFDLAIIVSSHIPSFTSFLLARASGAHYVLGYSTLPFYDGAIWSRYLAHVELPLGPSDAHETTKFLNLVRPLGADATGEPEFALSDAAKAWAKEAWNAQPSANGKRRVGLFLAGNPDRPERLWAPARWAELAKRLRARGDVELMAIVPPPKFLSGSRTPEPGFYEAVAAHLTFTLPRFSERNLERLAAFLKGFDLFIIPDGGLFHSAVACGVRTLGLFFETKPTGWMPMVPWVSVVRPDDGQAASLAVDDVVRRAEQLLAHPVPAVK